MGKIMADLNALIAQGAQFAAPPDPFAQYGKMQQLRVGENQNALAQYQLESAKRTDLQQNALNRAYSDAVDPATGQIDYSRVSKSLAAGGAGSQIPAALKQQAEFKKAQDESTKLQSELLANKLKLLPNAYKMADTPEAYLELHKSIHADPILGPWLKSTGATPERGFAQIQEAIKTGKFNDLRMGSMQSVAQLLDSMKPITVASGSSVYNPQTGTFTQAPESTNTDLIRNYTAAKNQGFVGSIFDYQQRIAAAGRAPRAESPLEKVVDPNTGEIVFASREEALRNRMTPANTVEKPMTQAQRVKYTKDKVSDKNVVTGAFAIMGELEKLTDELVGNPDKKIAPAPGLNSITGYRALTNPLALPKGDARKALQKLETFKGKIMALGRQLASQEGKLGNMAVQEWKFVSDAVQKIDPAAGNLDEQMRDVVRQTREYAQRQQSKYDDTYADDLTTQGSKTAPAAGGPKEVDFGSLK
jgi:hypothetical protein